MQITLYTKPNCPYCNQAKNTLTENGVEFNVTEDLKDIKGLGFKYVPVAKVDGEFYDTDSIFKNLPAWIAMYKNHENKEEQSVEKVDGRKLMADAKFYDSYARFSEKDDRYETWEESVHRVMDMHREFYKDRMTDELSKILDEVESGYKDKLFLGAQRALQFGGDQLLKKHSRLFNCSSSYCNRPDFFGGLFYFLLCGCGVGFSVQKHHIDQLPPVQKRTKSAKTYVVPDSIEGWATSVDVLLSSYFVGGGVYPEYEGRRVYFDLSNIRPKGSFISGGFKAPGPEPLRKTLDNIEHLIERELKKEKTRLSSIVLYDICMFISDAVLSGGIRRAATICLFSKDDKDMATAKTGNWFIENPQRGRSNNSVVLLRDETTFEEFQEFMKSVKEFGEPGFIWTDDLDFIFNPCVTADTKVLTTCGEKTVQELIGKKFNAIVNGREYASTSNGFWKTGTKKVYKITTIDGLSVRATEDHKFLCYDDNMEKVWCQLKDISEMDTMVLNDGKWDIVVSIVEDGFEDVYDVTIDRVHCFVANGFIAHNCAEISMKPITSDGRSGYSLCNLSEINGSKSTSKDIFFEQCKYAAILGTLQAGYTEFPFMKDATKEIVEREALIGVGITGMMNNPDVLFDEDTLKYGADVVKFWNKKIADMIGINQAARTTTIKPSGNSAVLLQCSSGIHGEHSQKYIRNVVFSKTSEVAQLLLETNPHMCSDSVWNPERDLVVSFPVVSNGKSLYKKDLLGVEQLKYVKLVQQTWIENGTNPKLSVDRRLRHNVSNTITVDDWDEVTNYIYDNRYYLCGVSLLSALGDKAYPQAPFTEVLEANEIMNRYGQVSLFTSALIEAGLLAFNNNLWNATSTALGYGEKLDDNHSDLLKRDFVRRFKKFATNFESEEECANCLKDVYNAHRFWKINRSIKNIKWVDDLGEKTYIDIDTTGAVACGGGQCEV